MLRDDLPVEGHQLLGPSIAGRRPVPHRGRGLAKEITGRDEKVGGAVCVAQRLVVVAELVQRVGQIAEYTGLADHVVHRPVGQSLLWCHLAASQPRVF